MKTRDLIILLLISSFSLAIPVSLFVYVLIGPPLLKQAPSTWSSLLIAPGIFPLEIDPIGVVKFEGIFYPPSILIELEELLSDPAIVGQLYTNYKTMYNETGDDAQKLAERTEIFRTKILQIAEHNLDYVIGEKSWVKGLSPFTDLTAHEFLTNFTGRAIPPKINDTTHTSKFLANSKPAPESWDWRDHHVFPPIKNQGQCSSSTLFAVANLVEFAMAHDQNKTWDLSVQELMDCSGNKTQTSKGPGCQGSWPTSGLTYVQNFGLASSSDYPYEGQENPCRSNEVPRSATIKGYGQAPPDEEQWKQFLVQGPLAVILNINSQWQDYRGGYFDDRDCSASKNNLQSVNLIGYGTDKSGLYWLLRNSWGPLWGLDGYMKIARGKNLCLINNFPAFYIT